jgi:hypothetical protein
MLARLTFDAKKGKKNMKIVDKILIQKDGLGQTKRVIIDGVSIPAFSSSVKDGQILFCPGLTVTIGVLAKGVEYETVKEEVK